MIIKNASLTKAILLATGAMVLSSCSTHVSRNNVEDIQQVNHEAHKLMAARIQEESKKFLEHKKDLYKAIQNVEKTEEVVEAVEPEFNPLDAAKISVNVNNGDVQILLQAIAEQAGMSLLLDPDLATLRRKISMHLKDVPASLVFEQVTDLLDLDGEVKGNVLIVRPYREKVYELNFLQTSTTIDYSMGGDVFGANQNSSGGGGSSQAMTGNLSFSGSGAEDSNPYSKLRETLEDIIGRSSSKKPDSSIPGVTNQPALGGLNRNTRQVITPRKAEGFQPVYTLNEMTGTLYLKAKPSQVDAVDKLVKQYKSVLSRQVLIEAQILDIQLGDGFKYGIDWNRLTNDVAVNYGAGNVELGGISSTIPNAGGLGSRSITIPSATYGAADTGALKFMTTNNDGTSLAIQALQQYGNLSVLSNPSIRAKNSRPAFISVGRSTQYISETSSTVTNTGAGATTTSDVTTSSVFDGIILGFEPFIDSDGKISLTVHPMQSTVDSSSMELVDIGGGSKISLPVIDFKGLTTSLSLNDGDTVILGGLIDEKDSNAGNGVPGLNEWPGIGALFGGSRMNDKDTRELVIVLRVSII